MFVEVHVAGKVPTGVLNEPGSILEAEAIVLVVGRCEMVRWMKDGGREVSVCVTPPCPACASGTIAQLGFYTSRTFPGHHTVQLQNIE